MAKKTTKSAVKTKTKTVTKAKKAKPGPKSAQILNLLQRQTGASIAELMMVTGWQAHSVRGFISGTLKRKQGLVVTSTVAEGQDRRYVIVSAP